MSEKKIFITTGDADGIGLEVALKALKKLGPQKGFKFVLFYEQSEKVKVQKALAKNFDLIQLSSLEDSALGNRSSMRSIFHIPSANDPAQWVKACAEFCLNHKGYGLTTGPLSKEQMRASGHPELGHTEILKKLTKSDFLFQAYLGSKFNVLLATDHTPLVQVSTQIFFQDRLQHALNAALELKKKLSISGKIAVLGLNPHAGEGGLIGNEDQRIKQILLGMDPKEKQFLGPLPADSAFSRPDGFFGLYVALYHDQGLIPFKSLHGFSEGVHLTMGIPFVRTSVDHGTAKDLFGKKRADEGSMFSALKSAITLMRKM